MILAFVCNPEINGLDSQEILEGFYCKIFISKCGPALWIACWSEGKEQEKAMEQAWEHLRTLENELKGKKFFGGESIGFVDIVANAIAFWFGVFEEVVGITLLDEEKFPTLCGWIEQFLSCDVVKECLPPRNELLMFFQARKEAISSSAFKSMVY
ncbi:hypothetical protein NE237_010118 [Protea cynaroides]|uniref:glutathione transferase n=1 Tax=Protea cynaroides TaxID=273540 RepID=A0A9Q0KYZ3_9MAGN|nr:hypothetical protein NE237_010118 [Protea cynaroides]